MEDATHLKGQKHKDDLEEDEQEDETKGLLKKNETSPEEAIKIL